MTAAFAAAPDRPAPIPGRQVDTLLLEIGGWLAGPDIEARSGVGPRDPSDRAALRRVIGAHGLGPYLGGAPGLASVRASLPLEDGAWLAQQLSWNRARIGRLHDELAAALAAMARRGVRVVPLKGALLTTRPGPMAGLRPMSDIDLLVRPSDRAAATAALVDLGYRRRPEPHRRATHDVFELPGNGMVRAFDGEHPDNPRRIELHVEVRRHLWAWTDDDDLTGLLWSSARDGLVLGEPAAVPSDGALLAHLAIHATCDLLLRRGRLVQWLDLAALAGGSRVATGGLPHPRLAYPSLRLAARRLPGPMADVDLRTLGGLVPDSLRRWAQDVPLDRACGLQSGRYLPGDAATFGARWDRWAPHRWRLRAAYGDAPVGLAATRHAARLAATVLRRLER